jgi:hypothetical protein
MFARTALPSRWIAAFAIALVCALGTPGLTSPSAALAGQKKGKKDEKPAAAKGTPVLWRDPGDVAALDLFWGIGGADKAPKPPFKFVKEDTSGTNPKIRVTDANGVTWNMKFDEEVHSEVACSRIAWACGYMVEESYFVPSGTVEGVSGLGRAKKFVGANGSFSNAMFEKRPAEITRRGQFWSWDSNPFSGSKELSGLAILAVMLNNWDAKQDNNNVLGIPASDGAVNDWYIVADWGGTLGKMGGVFSHSKWDLDAYRKQGFIEKVSGGMVELSYTGKGGRILKAVPVEHARWFCDVVGKLSDDQLRAAFRAAGADQTETSGFTTRIREKINELKSAVGH